MRQTWLLDAAGGEAEELRHGWVGVEHLLLALGRGAGPAAQALVDVDLWLAPPGPPEWTGAEMTPALQDTLAWVDGFTVGREATPEDALIAVLWLHPAHVGARRDEIAGRLSELDVAVPELEPLPPPTEFGDEVRFPAARLSAVLHAVHAAHPGVKLAFDREGEAAWLRAERGVDLAAIVG